MTLTKETDAVSMFASRNAALFSAAVLMLHFCMAEVVTKGGQEHHKLTARVNYRKKTPKALAFLPFPF